MRHLYAVPATDVFVPLQVYAELHVGAAKSANPPRSMTRVTEFLAPFRVVWPDSRVEENYVTIRTLLEAKGTPIGEADLWIAATVRAAGGTLVTNNTGEFSRVPSLLIEDWTLA